MTSSLERTRPSLASSDKDKQLKRSREPRENKPCERCKTQHLKCIHPAEASKCQRCARFGAECVRFAKKIRFRDVQVSNSTPDNKNRRGNSNSEVITFSSLTASGANTSTETRAEESPRELQHNSVNRHGSGVDSPLEITDANGPRRNEASVFIEKRLVNRANEKPNTTSSQVSEEYLGTHTDTEVSPVTRVFSTDAASVLSFGSSPHRQLGATGNPSLLDQMVKAPKMDMASGTQRYLETILLRYFHEELAPWFDICDPFHHFADVIPQKARKPGPLRSALLTISARNLSHNQMFRSSTGTAQWKGHLLPDLTSELAMSYHNECIRELLQLSLNHEKLYDETLLAAVVILRTDEEMLHEVEDKELFLRISSLFIDAQLPSYLALPRTSPQISYTALRDETVPSPLAHNDSELGSSGLRQACFWTALRQDLHAAFLKQQSVKFPLQRCEIFRQISPANDAVWANRMVVFCADVLEFCYGSESIDAKILPAYTDQERWQRLRSHEENLLVSLPSSFEPTYCREPDFAQDEIFPSLFYLETPHVSGTTYIELARMLLEVFNPARPKLGHGYIKATKVFVSYTKKILYRLCGIALSNSDICPPSLVNASLGISLFGEYVEDAKERSALLGVLSLMIQRYNYYPTAQIAQSLQQAWSGADDEYTPPGTFSNVV